MKLRIERETGQALEAALQELLAAEPHLPYANFAPIAARDPGVIRLHTRLWRAEAEPEGMLVAREAGGRPLAMLRTRQRRFESQHFGRNIASIEQPAAVADETLRLAALRGLYRAALAELRTSYQHVTAAASTRDRIACWVLQELGCFHVGTRISWMAPLDGKREPHELPSNLSIEMYDRRAPFALPPESCRRLREWAATAFDRGPFVFDLAVPSDRAAAIYEVWTEKALTGEWADILLVVRDGGEVVAFNSMMLLPELSEAAGVAVLGRGIGASLPQYRGLFTALQKECAAVRPLGAGFLETETQAATVASINVFGKLGHQCLRSTASFHLNLDERGAGLRGVDRDPLPQ